MRRATSETMATNQIAYWSVHQSDRMILQTNNRTELIDVLIESEKLHNPVADLQRNQYEWS
jgi:hypothetical protein